MTEARYIDTVDTAKMIRKELKATFPATKFSVRSKTYAGGSSINVGWTDGPTTASVDKILKKYEGASFDGMIDLKSYQDTEITNEDGTTEKVHFASDYVFSNRKASPAAEATIAQQIATAAGKPYDENGKYNLSVHRDSNTGEVMIAHNSWQTEYGASLLHQIFQYTPL